MYKWSAFAPLLGPVAAILLAVGCRDSVAPPERHDPAGPALVVVGPQPAISGTGTLGTGAAASGGDRQEFDFDVRADLTGRLFYRDWRFSATITVDEDPATRITAFRDRSTACAAPANGAEFDGIGRRSTGVLYEGFTVVACDDGPAGSGADGLGITTATEYSNAGLLSSGDIVKTVVASPIPPPVASFTFSCSGLTCSFDASSSTAQAAATYSWNWGDGTPAGSGKTATHTYGAGGSYSVTLTVTDGGGSSSTTQSVTVDAVNRSPVADFTFTCSGLACSFTSTSSDPDGTIAAYSWTFGDGGTSTARNPSHTYAAGGTYTVKLTVTDNRGARATTSKNVTVTASNQPPTATFTFSCNGLTCSFTSTSNDPDGTIAAQRWTFGDGGTSTAQNPSHTYAAGGTYTVKLTVTDNRGATASASKNVTVSQPNRAPTVNAGSDERVLLGLFYTLSASFSDPDNGPWSYTINWGDGSSTSGTKSSQGTISAGHNYLLIGTYTIRVTVTDSRGASGSDTKVLTVFIDLGGIL